MAANQVSVDLLLPISSTLIHLFQFATDFSRVSARKNTMASVVDEFGRSGEFVILAKCHGKSNIQNVTNSSIRVSMYVLLNNLIL
jgi:hypothetical protein